MKYRRIGPYEIHPAADKFDLITGPEFDELVENIKLHGQLVKIWWYRVGKKKLILDGRNRLRALIKLGTKPIMAEYAGGDPIGFVWALNARRRHTSKSQLALVAAELADLDQGQRKNGKRAEALTQEQAAKKFNLSERSVRSAKAVLDSGIAEVKKAVKGGRMAIDVAASLAQMPAKRQRTIVKQLGDSDSKKEIKSGHLRALMKLEKRRQTAEKIEREPEALPTGPFRVIVADPPWLFKNSDGHTGSRGHTPYPPMPTHKICALGAEIKKLAHDDCVLWLWATNWHLAEGDAGEVVRA